LLLFRLSIGRSVLNKNRDDDSSTLSANHIMINKKLPSMEDSRRGRCLSATEDDDIVNRLIHLNLSSQTKSFLAGDKKMDIDNDEARRRIIIKAL
jgi:hypothetical protein